MALIGSKLAVASVGLSCQTAHQIIKHQLLISEIAGENLEIKATPFDWLLAPVSSIIGLVKTERFYPDGVSELMGEDKPYWPAADVHFWHRRLSDFPAWGERVSDGWRRLKASRRKVFIVSNMQNNILQALKEYDREPFDLELPPGKIRDLHKALHRSVGECELHVVTRERFPGESADVGWKGDHAQWRGMFLTILRT